MADRAAPTTPLRDAVMGERNGFCKWEGGVVGEIRFPPCFRNGNVIRIPWRVGDPIEPMEPLVLYRYVCREGNGFLELTLNKQGKPTI